MITNKKFPFTKILSKAILDLKDTGKLKIMNMEKSREHKSCGLPDQRKEKPMGYEKLACLFIVMLSGILTSLFIALIEYVAKKYLKDQTSATPKKGYEINPMDNFIEEFLEDLSSDEKKAFQGILHKYIDASGSQHYVKKLSNESQSVTIPDFIENEVNPKESTQD